MRIRIAVMLFLVAPAAMAEPGADFTTSPANPTPQSPPHLSLASLVSAPDAQPAPNALEAAFLNGTPWLDARYRFEDVSQDGIHRHAEASTLRTRLGYESGLYDDFKLGFELQNITPIGSEHYNNAVNGHTLYPAVIEPSGTNLNQGYVAYDGMPKTEIKLGRQIINLDDQRFVGMSDWRQHDTTFDAGSIYSTYFDRTALFYAYVRQVNRIYGEDSPVGTLIGNTHLLNASYQFSPLLKVTGYSYLLDFQSSATGIKNLSSATGGFTFTGSYALPGSSAFSYTIEGAHQDAYGDNPVGTSENYYLIEPAIRAFGFTGKLGYEMLEGNGSNAFQTPLATFHSFDGWADKFLVTPSNGLLDKYASLTYKLPYGGEAFQGIELTGVYRKFNSDKDSLNDGHEWDGLLSQTFLTHYTASLEVADYRAGSETFTPLTDTCKIMAFLTVRY